MIHLVKPQHHGLMAKADTFWTPKRLIELRVKARTLQIDQLAGYFGKQPDDIIQALRFEVNKRHLYRGIRKETINGKTITITLYAAEFAEGAKEVPICWKPPLF